jgi:hypothetical protein
MDKRWIKDAPFGSVVEAASRRFYSALGTTRSTPVTQSFHSPRRQTPNRRNPGS